MCARSKAAAKSSNSSQSSGSIGRRIFQRIAIGWLTRIRKWLSIDFLFVHFVVEGRFLCQTVTQISYEAFCSCPQTFCDETTKIVRIVCPLKLNPVAHFYFLKQGNIQNGMYEFKKKKNIWASLSESPKEYFLFYNVVWTALLWNWCIWHYISDIGPELDGELTKHMSIPSNSISNVTNQDATRLISVKMI